VSPHVVPPLVWRFLTLRRCLSDHGSCEPRHKSCNAVLISYRRSLSTVRSGSKPRRRLPAAGVSSIELWLKCCHRRLPGAHDADICDEILGVSADVACGAPTGSAAWASISAQAQPTGRSVRRAKPAGARIMAMASVVSAQAMAGSTCVARCELILRNYLDPERPTATRN
jgi:hypothetical protein